MPTSSGDGIYMTAHVPGCNSARPGGQACPAGRRPVCPAPSLVRAARRDRAPARVQARHVPPSRSFRTRRSLPMQPPLDRRDPTPPASDDPLRVSSWRRYTQGGKARPRAPRGRNAPCPAQDWPAPKQQRPGPVSGACILPLCCVRPPLRSQHGYPGQRAIIFACHTITSACFMDAVSTSLPLQTGAPSPRADAAPVAARPLRGSMITAGQGGAALRSPALDRLTHLSFRAR
jgi:hypothetical protein